MFCTELLSSCARPTTSQLNTFNDIALHEQITSELPDVTCHMGSHSVTCFRTQVNTPRLTRARQDETRFNLINLTRRDWKLSWPMRLDTYRAGLPVSRRMCRLDTVEKWSSNCRILLSFDVAAVCRCDHDNVVKMIGYSTNGPYRCIVYELMSNGSLEDRLACSSVRHVHCKHFCH